MKTKTQNSRKNLIQLSGDWGQVSGFTFQNESTLILKKRLYNEHYPSILVTFLGETEHFSGKNGALRWSILVGKQKHNVQKPICCWYSAGGRKTDRRKPRTTAGLCYSPMEVKNSEGSSGVISIGNSMICSDISRLLYVIWDNFEISRVVFMPNFKYKSCCYLFILPAKVLLFSLHVGTWSWNTCALSQSNCRNFSCGSITYLILVTSLPVREK